MYQPFLIAMQAAGVALDVFNAGKQQDLIRVGRQLEQEAIETNLVALRTQSADESLQSMRSLRQTLGSQIAVQAARGNATNSGTAVSLQQESVRAFNDDERVRRMNLLSNEASLRASNVLSGLHTLQSETQLGQALTKRLLNQLPISSTIDEFRKTSLAKSFGFGLDPAEA